MIELHKSGEPHWHSICHGDFLPPLFLKWACAESGIGHSDIRKIKSNLGMAYYCVKHLAHAHGRRWPGRQVRYSRGFFVNGTETTDPEMDELPKEWEVVFGRAPFVAQKLRELGYIVSNHDDLPDLLEGEKYDPDSEYKWRQRTKEMGYGIFDWKSKGKKFYEE